MEISHDNPKLVGMVERAREGKIVLPEFQRDFVWSRDGIAELLVSILKGYFIGTFLALRTDVDNNPFAVRGIQGVEKHPEDLLPELMLLDGQQRLTSLHYALAAPSIPLRGTKSSWRFFLNLNKLSPEDLDDAVTSQQSSRCKEMLKRETQFLTSIVPFTEIERWDDWLNAYEKWLIDRDKDEYFEFREHRMPIWKKAIDILQQARVYMLTIPRVSPEDPDRVDEVCAIFEKMNSTGVQLSVFDLLTARLFRHQIKLRELWEEAVKEHDYLRVLSGGDSSDYGTYTLRTMALIRRTEIRRKTLINLSPDDFEEDWRTVTRYVNEALQRMQSTNQDGFGAFEPKWIPYSTMVSTLAALLHYIQTHDADHRAYKYIRKWYWGSVFLERYAGAVETVSTRDYRDLVALFEDEGCEPDVFAEIDDRILSKGSFSLLGVSRVNSTYRGVISLVAKRGARDFRTGDSIEFHKLDDHHIFPRAYLRELQGGEGKKRYSQGDVNQVLNRTLISSATNKLISDHAPSEYVEGVVPEERKVELMDSHFIDKEALAAMEVDDYEAFLLRHEELLSSEIVKQLQV